MLTLLPHASTGTLLLAGMAVVLSLAVVLRLAVVPRLAARPPRGTDPVRAKNLDRWKGRPRAGLFVVGTVARGLATSIPQQTVDGWHQHWKNAPVLPMFRAHPLAFDPGFRKMRA
jgi:hypothetical protein